MPIVKRRKKEWFNKDLTKYEETIKINLNKNDYFEFEVPSHYIEVFKQTSFPDMGDNKFSNQKVIFATMLSFDSCFGIVNTHFKEQVITLTEEKVLVVSLEGRTNNNICSGENVFRMNWSGIRSVNTFIDFKFERGMRVGSIIYKIESPRLGGGGKNWDKSNDTFRSSHLKKNSKETRIIIPYTEEREKFLRSFHQELSNMIQKIDRFMDIFEKPETLTLIDNGGFVNMLSASPLEIEGEVIETIIEPKPTK